MKIPLNQRPSGIALIIVMIAVLSLSILAGMYAYSMKVEGKLAMNSNNEAELEWMGRSGVEAAKYVLALEAQAGGVDSLESKWAGGPGSAAISNSPLAGISLPWTFPLGNGSVTVEPMIDQERKANINMADDTLLEQALIEMGVDAGQYPTIVNSIHDWIDADDATRMDGAEADYYQSRNPPCLPKNGPVDDLSELQLVKGIYENPELYDPKLAGQVPSRILKNSRTRLGFNADVPIYHVGLVDLFTPISSGRININTASREVKQLVTGDERSVEAIERLLVGPDGVTPIPLNNVGEVINAGLPQSVVQQVQRYCDVHSRTFEVHISAEVKGFPARKFTAILVRNSPRDAQVLSFRSVE